MEWQSIKRGKRQPGAVVLLESFKAFTSTMCEKGQETEYSRAEGHGTGSSLGSRYQNDLRFGGYTLMFSWAAATTSSTASH